MDPDIILSALRDLAPVAVMALPVIIIAWQLIPLSKLWIDNREQERQFEREAQSRTIATNEVLLNSLTMLNANLERQETEHRARETELQARIVALEKAEAAKSKELEVLRKELNEVKQDRDRVQTERDHLEKRVNELEAEVKDLRSRLNEAKKANGGAGDPPAEVKKNAA